MEPINPASLAIQGFGGLAAGVDEAVNKVKNEDDLNRPITPTEHYLAQVTAGRISGRDAAILAAAEHHGVLPPTPRTAAHLPQNEGKLANTATGKELAGPPAPASLGDVQAQAAGVQEGQAAQSLASAPPVPAQPVDAGVRTNKDFQTLMAHAPLLVPHTDPNAALALEMLKERNRLELEGQKAKDKEANDAKNNDAKGGRLDKALGVKSAEGEANRESREKITNAVLASRERLAKLTNSLRERLGSARSDDEQRKVVADTDHAIGSLEADKAKLLASNPEMINDPNVQHAVEALDGQLETLRAQIKPIKARLFQRYDTARPPMGATVSGGSNAQTEQTNQGQVEMAKAWLQANPTSPHAPAVRARLQKMGIQVP